MTVISLAGAVLGTALVAAALAISGAVRVEGVPLDESHPGLSLLTEFFIYIGISLCIISLINFVMSLISLRKYRVFIDGIKSEEIKVFKSRYKAETLKELELEIKNKLRAENYESVDGVSGGFWRAGRRLNMLTPRAFMFAQLEDFAEFDRLIAKTKELWRGVFAAFEGGGRSEIDAAVFLAVDNAADDQIAALPEFRNRLFEEFDGVVQLCLYDLSEKRVYCTCYTQNVGYGIVVENLSAFIQNLAAGMNKPERTARKPAPLRKEKQKPEPDSRKVDLDSNPDKEYALKIQNVPFIVSVVFTSILFPGFILALIIWLVCGASETLLFFALTVPLLLVPGLVLIYFTLSSYKRIVINERGMEMRRVFGNIKLFGGGLLYAEKQLAVIGVRVIRCYCVFPSGTVLEDEIVFKKNNYKCYVLVKYCAYNKAVLERIFTKSD